ncbi:hypothetical protein OJAV_G00090700 [Oryzias javanicus]|uniref:Uncharacterized protein n=1 Tax=Oryzias javanicus TaxID=123683 RepID=A0A3S2MWF5_ORYJA|nr:hypothetical protein OJAV_G00090700 [Oryzias javanicus]
MFLIVDCYNGVRVVGWHCSVAENGGTKEERPAWRRNYRSSKDCWNVGLHWKKKEIHRVSQGPCSHGNGECRVSRSFREFCTPGRSIVSVPRPSARTCSPIDIQDIMGWMMTYK